MNRYRSPVVLRSSWWVLVAGGFLACGSEPRPATPADRRPIPALPPPADAQSTTTAPPATLRFARLPDATDARFATDVDVVMAHPAGSARIPLRDDRWMALPSSPTEPSEKFAPGEAPLSHRIYVRRSRYSADGHWLALRWYVQDALNQTDPPGGLAFVTTADGKVRQVLEGAVNPIWLADRSLLARRGTRMMRLELSDDGVVKQVEATHELPDFGCTSETVDIRRGQSCSQGYWGRVLWADAAMKRAIVANIKTKLVALEFSTVRLADGKRTVVARAEAEQSFRSFGVSRHGRWLCYARMRNRTPERGPWGSAHCHDATRNFEEVLTVDAEGRVPSVEPVDDDRVVVSGLDEPPYLVDLAGGQKTVLAIDLPGDVRLWAPMGPGLLFAQRHGATHVLDMKHRTIVKVSDTTQPYPFTDGTRLFLRKSAKHFMTNVVTVPLTR